MSKTDRRIGKKVPDYIRREDSSGVRLDAGPYIGKIKNNYDTIRQGRLQVWIPDIGAGDENDPSNWRTVSYASPFTGATSQEEDKKDNKFKKGVRHTYGFWFTPPDIDNFVLCTFVAGDPMRGFWFACIPVQAGQHMIPAIAGSANYDDKDIDSDAVKKMSKSPPLPVAEFNENADQDWSNFVNLKKALHETQIEVLLEQGLDRDTTRGVISSSSQRESPSKVFGISTPGRALSGATNDQLVYSREGGHTFVMDDGDFANKNKLFRIRTSGGHQLIMNDSDDVLYIGNSKGTAWVELTGSGDVNVFGTASINLRAQENINFHAGKDINIHSDGKFNLFAKTSVKIESEAISSVSSKRTTIYGNGIEVGSESTIDINAKSSASYSAGPELILSGTTIKLNSGKGPTVAKPEKITINDLYDAEKDGNGQWQSKPAKLKSIVKKAPTHEPWGRDGGKPNPAASGAASASGSNGGSLGSASGSGATQTVTGAGAVDGFGNPVLKGSSNSSDAGLKSALGGSVRKPASKEEMYRSDNPTPTKGVGNLDPIDKKALKTQIAKSESGGKYDIVESNRGNYLGKYQVGASALVGEGYIKPDAYAKYGTAAVNYPSSWTGKDGVSGKQDFLNNHSAQENAMDGLLDKNYAALQRTGGVRSTDSKETVSGMLATSHLLGAGGATTWRNTGGGADANGTTGTAYFNMGRYASNVLAKTS